MDSGFYAAVNGAKRADLRLEVISNNLANSNTTGYKQDNVNFDSFMTSTGPELFPLPTDSFMGMRGPGDIPFPFSNPASNAYRMTYPMATGTTTDLAQGSLQPTGNALDVAIEGRGMFSVETPQGPRYTRDGSFAVNGNGELVTKDGFRVMGDGGAAIVVGSDPVQIAHDGTISNTQGPLGRLMRVAFPEEHLAKEGSNLYSAVENAQPEQITAEGGVQQGFLEGSNADPIRGMTQMIETHRAFDTYMKMIQALDSLDGQAASSIGKLQGS